MCEGGADRADAVGEGHEDAAVQDAPGRAKLGAQDRRPRASSGPAASSTMPQLDGERHERDKAREVVGH
jgi:hypothetical protein